MSTELTTAEAERLTELEQVIERGKAAFVQVGSALRTIRESRLYRQSHDTFEDYCRERWGFSKRRANQLVEAAEVIEDATVESGNNCSQTPPILTPQNEGQARALSSAPKAERASVWKEAVESAPKGKDGKPKVTAKHVEQVVAKRREPVHEPIVNPAPTPDGNPWDEYNAELASIADMIRDVRDRMLALAARTDETGLFADWIDSSYKTYYDNHITAILEQRVAGLMSESEADALGWGRRHFYHQEIPKVERLRKKKGRAA